MYLHLFSIKIDLEYHPNSYLDLISEKLAIVPSEGLPPNILKLRCLKATLPNYKITPTYTSHLNI